MEAYTGFAGVYDQFMNNVPYREWADFIELLFADQGINEGLLLELGCGGDCMKCPEPCRVYKLAVTKICDEECKKQVKKKQAQAFAREALAMYLQKEAEGT